MRKPSSAPRKPNSSLITSRDTLAFMFETQLVLHPTRFAMETDCLQRDYFQVWQALKKHFTGRPIR